MGTFIQSMHAGYAGAGSDRKRTFSGTLFLVTVLLKACVRYFLSNFDFFTKCLPFKNYEKRFLFHLKSSFHS